MLHKIGVALFLVLMTLLQIVPIVHERRKVIIFQFGQLKNVYNDPFIELKILFIQDMVFCDRRLQNNVIPMLKVTAVVESRTQTIWALSFCLA
jgi:hypothetical protein